jgi:hypothetical protein
MEKRRMGKTGNTRETLERQQPELKTSLEFSSNKEQTLAPNSHCYISKLQASISSKSSIIKSSRRRRGICYNVDREPKELLLH